MSKPLVLRTYSEWQHEDGTWYATIDDPRRPIRSGVEVLRKRFKPGELAAEYWHQVGIADQASEGYSHDVDGYQFNHEYVEFARRDLLFYFAAAPDHDA